MNKYKLAFVNTYVDRLGKLRHYFRGPGQARAIPLPGKFKSPEFLQAYGALLAGIQAPNGPARSAAQRKTRAAIDGSTGEAVRQYLKSDRFYALAPTTRTERLRYLAKFGEAYGLMPLAEHTTKKLNDGLVGILPNVLRQRITALRGFFDWASHPSRALCSGNPAAALEKPAEDSEAHHTWTDDQIRQWWNFYPLGTIERTAFDLYIHTGQRGSDIVQLGWHSYRNDGATLYIAKQEKTEKPAFIPVSAALKQTLDLIPRPEPTATMLHPPFLRKVRGSPFTRHKLTDAFREWRIAAGLPEECVPHGLRRAAVRIMLEEGMQPAGIAAITGQSLELVYYYAEDYAREKAAVAAMPGLSRRLEAINGS